MEFGGSHLTVSCFRFCLHQPSMRSLTLGSFATGMTGSSGARQCLVSVATAITIQSLQMTSLRKLMVLEAKD